MEGRKGTFQIHRPITSTRFSPAKIIRSRKKSTEQNITDMRHIWLSILGTLVGLKGPSLSSWVVADPDLEPIWEMLLPNLTILLPSHPWQQSYSPWPMRHNTSNSICPCFKSSYHLGQCKSFYVHCICPLSFLKLSGEQIPRQSYQSAPSHLHSCTWMGTDSILCLPGVSVTYFHGRGTVHYEFLMISLFH